MQNSDVMATDAFGQPVPHLSRIIYNAKLFKQYEILTDLHFTVTHARKCDFT